MYAAMRLSWRESAWYWLAICSRKDATALFSLI
jgi:hypothetical protein